ncbi:hypothetical protein PRIC1_010246 [Phytophthora ramorum]|uniref:uncharacterized protein n=1 Tax=Phytophthora ramorum TaxID=164328 RepID=UPI0030A21579|nr:hypothetical protein KRP23_11041 [Phytophthora ramorum]KAH7498585.1 hypothetical protein KRP22_11726 [Phytophthora ramorum]
MVEVIVSERERLDLVRQGDNIFLEVQERLYNAQAQRPQSDAKDKYVTTFDTFTVYGSLDDVTELYVNDDKKMVLDFSESRELAVLKPSTKKRPLDRVSLRWSLFHSPSRLLAKDQDFCYLEVMKPYGTQSGRRGWAKCVHSIKHEACPEFTDSQGIHVNRAELFFCGLFFEETEAVGVLNATVYYNIKRDNIPPVVMPMVLKARSKRSIELVNHYLRMSNTILNSRKHSLTIALQLQAEKRCGACTNHLSMWKLKDKCLLCGSFLCDKCDDIVGRNFRVDGITRGQVVCFSCAARRGTKSILESNTRYVDLDASANSGSAVKTHSNSILGTDQDGGFRDGSISSMKEDDEFPKWFDASAKLSHEQDQPSVAPERRHSQFIPHETFYLPSDHAAQQRRRATTRLSTRQPRKGLDEDFIMRRRSRTTGNSRLSSRAKPTGCAPTSHKDSPTAMETAADEPIAFAPIKDAELQHTTQ